VFGELKGGFPFGCVPTMRYAGRSAWQLLSALAFNLMRGLQTATTAQPRRPMRRRRGLFRFETIHMLRYLCLQRAGVIVRPDGCATLEVGRSRAVVERFTHLDRRWRWRRLCHIEAKSLSVRRNARPPEARRERLGPAFGECGIGQVVPPSESPARAPTRATHPGTGGTGWRRKEPSRA